VFYPESNMIILANPLGETEQQKIFIKDIWQ